MNEPKASGFFSYISQAWLVILLALVFGTALASVELALKPRILENKRQKTLRQVPKLFKQYEAPTAEEWVIQLDETRSATVLKVLEKNQTIGWVLPGSGQGFADKIEILLAVDSSFETILGVSVLKQSETPGLGDYITSEKEPFRQDFASGLLKTRAKVVVVKSTDLPDPNKNQVEAISGATISSEAVTKIVNQTIQQYKDRIKEGQ